VQEYLNLEVYLGWIHDELMVIFDRGILRFH